MMDAFGPPDQWLPVAFAALMGLSILIYVILDGFDLGVGILMPLVGDDEKDRFIASIGPFWDANETWLVMAVGILLVAFPAAHGQILTALYIPVAVMLVGLILRGVAFEMRAKAPAVLKHRWNQAFFAGSVMTGLSQGFMLGIYIMGLEYSWASIGFSVLTALCLTGAYAFIGATWLIIKTEGELQQRAVRWARRSLLWVMSGMVAVSITTPLVSERIFEKWFSVPEFFLLAPLPLLSALMVGVLWLALKHLPDREDRWCWVPFAAASSVFGLGFTGLAYSFYPYVVPDQLTLYQAASAPESLMIIFLGVLFVLPAIIGYTILSYRIFKGKSIRLSYD